MPFCRKCGKELDAEAAFCPKCGTSVNPGAASQAPVSGMDSVIKEPVAQEYWFQRFIAYVIDSVLVFVVVGVIAVLLAIPIFFISGPAAMAAMLTGVFSFVAGIFLVLYFTVTESVTGASLGKRMMGLAVKAKGGQKPTFVEALARNVSKIYWVLLLLDIIVGLATTKEYTQKFSDRMVGTSVVKYRP